MCQNPVRVKNPYFSSNPLRYTGGEVSELARTYVSAREEIEVPCGKCADCRHTYFTALKQRCQMEALTSYVYFVTLTYNDEHIPFVQFSTDDGYVDLYYSDIEHIQLLMKRLRRLDYFQDRDFRYFAVTEFGSRRFRPHHHLLLFVARKPGDSPEFPVQLERKLWSDVLRLYGVNVGTNKFPVYDPFCTYVYNPRTKHSSYDLRLVRDYSKPNYDPLHVNSPDSVNKSINYIMTYVNKPSRYDDILTSALEENRSLLDPKTYRRLTRLLGSRCYYSKHLGFGYFDDGLKVRPSLFNFSLTRRKYNISGLIEGLPSPIQPAPRRERKLCDLTFSLMGHSIRLKRKYQNRAIYHDQPSPFEQLYPDLYYDYCNFLDALPQWIDHYLSERYLYQSVFLQRFLNDLYDYSPQWYSFFYLAMKYEKTWSKMILRMLPFGTDTFSPSLLPKSFDDSYMSSRTYKMIRRYIDTSLASGTKFIGFEYVFNGKVVYQPLCAYFRRYCATFEDMQRAYRNAGVTNFDEYIDSFEPNIESFYRNARAQITNNEKHESDREDVYNDDFYVQNLVKQKIESIFVPRTVVLQMLNSN